MLIQALRRVLTNKDQAEIAIDTAERMAVHAEVLSQKPMLKEVFEEFHHIFLELDSQYFGVTPGLKIELGAGVAPIRDSYPDVLATDIMPSPYVDLVLNAQSMTLPNNSVRSLFAQNSFHHFPDPAAFFSEALRVLVPGGGIILLEPYYGLIASFIYKRLFASESFDKSMLSWQVPMEGPMRGANQAMSYIVFQRDRYDFSQRFPQLKIVFQSPLPNYIRYLLSGGLNFRQLVPDSTVPALKIIENALKPFIQQLALHHIIVLRREPTS